MSTQTVEPKAERGKRYQEAFQRLRAGHTVSLLPELTRRWPVGIEKDLGRKLTLGEAQLILAYLRRVLAGEACHDPDYGHPVRCDLERWERCVVEKLRGLRRPAQ